MSEIKDLVTFEKLDAMEIFTKEKGVDLVLTKVKDMVESFHGDASTEKGRAEIKSFCYKIARSKTYIDGVGKDLVAALKEKPKLIDSERRRVKLLLDSWAQECRKPLTEYEENEKNRVANIEEKINSIEKYTDRQNLVGLTKDDCTKIGNRLKSIESFEDFEEFSDRAEKARDQSLLTLRGMYAEIVENEEREVERKKEEEKRRVERENQIRIDAEKKAKEEVEAKNREIELLKIKAQKDKENAEKDRIESIKRAKIAEAEAKKQAEEAAKMAKKQAEEAAKMAKDKEQAEIKAREKDREHKARIHNEILVCLLESGITEDHSKSIIKMIASGKVKNVKINY